MTTAQMIQEMMANWDKISSAIKESDPHLSSEEVYQATKKVFEKSLGLPNAQ